MCLRFLEDPPYLKNMPPGKIDFFGVGFLALWIGCLQLMLDKGQDADWFSSNFICWLAVLAVIGFIVFLIRELTTRNPIVNLHVLKDRNLAIGVVLNLSVGAILYGTTTVLPLFLQNLLHYTSYEAGLVMTPRGIGAIIGSIIAGRIISKLDGRLRRPNLPRQSKRWHRNWQSGLQSPTRRPAHCSRPGRLAVSRRPTP
jgi:DHA2 family multidrug resistance protein